jgi:2-C-methyl-D-erythritol 2,4-cyclodiphosphate synthase
VGTFATGLGYDSHRFAEGRRLVLGGIEIPHERGLTGHSDADVLVHAIIDALLGAASLGNIGERFPSNDAQYAGISSLELLARTAIAVEVAGFRVVNVDSTVIAEGPRLQPHLGAMQANIAECLKLDRSVVSVKATSPEGLGAVGRELGIAAQAVALIEDR